MLRRLDTQKLRSLLSATTWVKNFCRSLDQAKASNKRMQEEGETRSRLLKPMAEPIDTWGPKLRAALEMNVFSPETPLKDMEFEEIEDLRDRYLNTKFLLNQSRNPFPASLLQELPCLAAQQREVERVAPEQGRDVIHRCLWP